jgi:hypothetical protein
MHLIAEKQRGHAILSVQHEILAQTKKEPHIRYPFRDTTRTGLTVLGRYIRGKFGLVKTPWANSGMLWFAAHEIKLTQAIRERPLGGQPLRSSSFLEVEAHSLGA